MKGVSISSVKHKNLTFDASRLGEVDLIPSEKEFAFLHKGEVRSLYIEQNIIYEEELNNILLSLNFKLGLDDGYYTETNIEPELLGNMMLKSFEDDIEFESLEGFKELYDSLYNVASDNLIHKGVILENTPIRCYGFVKDKNGDRLGFIDWVELITTKVSKVASVANLKIDSLTSFYSFEKNEEYSLELYTDGFRLLSDNFRLVDCFQDGSIKQCIFCLEGDIIYDNISIDKIPFELPQSKVSDCIDSKSTEKFIQEREALLHFSRDMILKNMTDSLFQL